MRLIVSALAFGVLAGSSLHAQYMISAHSGVVHYVEGKAYLNDTVVEPKFGKFPEIKENQELRTGEGRAEVLLTPGAFLRMSENSSIRMLSTRLTDTRVEILTGSAMVECDDSPKDNAVTLLYKGASMLLVKHGLYRLDANQTRFQVYDGESIVKGESGSLTLKTGKRATLAGALTAENFDRRQGDELYIWSSQRSSYLAKANVASAMALRDSGSYSGASSGNWSWNPMFGMFAFVPSSGTLSSSFGGSFWSPYTVGDYNSGYYYGGGRSSYSKGTSSFAPSGSQVGYANGAGRASGGGYSVPSAGGMGSGVHTGGGGVGRGAGAGRGR